MTFSKVLVAALLVGFPLKGFCWGATGHQLVGGIADVRMSPEGRAFVAGILDLDSASIASTWADEVRDDERFSHNEKEYDGAKRDADDLNFLDYHFVDVPTTFTYDTRPNKALKDSYGAIVGAIKILRDSSAERAQKAIALRYLIHLVGDIHQPLHVGNNHDVGANFCQVLWKKGTKPKNLHAVWDSSLVDEFGYTLRDASDPDSDAPFYPNQWMAAIKKYKSDLLNAPKPKDVSANAIKSWINESAEIRDNKAARPLGVYPEKPGALKQYLGEEYKHRPNCMWFEDKYRNVWGDTSPRNKKDIPASVIPRLDDDYVQTNVKVVEKQLFTAGIRLAAIIDDIAKDARRSETLDDDQQTSVLKNLQSMFHNNR